MEKDFEDTKKKPLTSRYRVCGIIIFCVFLLLILSSCRKRSSPTKLSKLPPPDLSGCTRIELRYSPSTVEYFFWEAKRQGLLNAEETEYLQSLKIIIDDPERIKALVHDVSQGSYFGPKEGPPNIRNAVHFVCYRDAEQLTSFTDLGNIIHTEDGQVFRYDKGFPSLQTLTIPQMRPFKLRLDCAENLWLFHSSLWIYFQSKKAYPAPDKWCDVIVREYRSDGLNKEEYMSHFKCPGVGQGKCHYAMNPHCTPNSSPETVLFFETNNGWNQYGGPELFTFDNHDPKGGCVLLNDGSMHAVSTPTVRFIRTKEELQQLRWK
jgi:hypothetical protein